MVSACQKLATGPHAKLVVSGRVVVHFGGHNSFDQPARLVGRSIMSGADVRLPMLFSIARPTWLHMARMMKIVQAGTRFGCMRMGSQMLKGRPRNTRNGTTIGLTIYW